MSLDITFKRFVNIPRASLLPQVLGGELLISMVWSDLCQERTFSNASIISAALLRPEPKA